MVLARQTSGNVGLGETYQPLAVKQCCAAAIRDGPVAEVEHMVDLLGQLGGIFVLSHKPRTALFAHTLHRKRRLYW